MSRRRPRAFAPFALAAVLAAVPASGATATAPGAEKPPRLRDYLQTSPAACGFGSAAGRAAARAARTGAPEAQVAAVTRAVQQIRRLAPAKPPAAAILSPEALRERLRRDAGPPAEPRFDPKQAALERLGAVPRRFKVAQAAGAAAISGFVGFYDHGRKEVVVGHADARRPLNVDELQTLAHEVEHALSDQVLGFPPIGGEEPWGDAARAKLALVEASARITELRFGEALLGGRAAAERLSTRTSAADFVGAARLPFVLRRSFAFPYLEGLGFVCQLYARGGWKRVNAAFRHPPTTSAQILFPTRYLRGERAREPGASSLPPPWRTELERGTFGAVDLLWLFEAPGGKTARALTRPRARAAAWGGGRIDVWTNGGDVAVAVALAEHPRGRGLCASVRAWYRAAFPAGRRSAAGGVTIFRERGQAAAIACSRKTVRLGIGSSAQVARRLVVSR